MARRKIVAGNWKMNMTDDHVRHACILQHGSGDLACECALLLEVHILGAHFYIGETLEQREMGVTMDWIRLQIKSDLTGVTADQVKGMVIAFHSLYYRYDVDCRYAVYYVHIIGFYQVLQESEEGAGSRPCSDPLLRRDFGAERDGRYHGLDHF